MRAIQFGPKRSGSTFLQHAINSHPDLLAIDELFVNFLKPQYKKSGFTAFCNSDYKNPVEYLNEVIYKKYPDNKTSFKLMYNQMSGRRKLIDYILEKNIPLIHLMRKNLVKMIISGKNAGIVGHKPLHIPGITLLREVENAERLNKYWADKFKNNIRTTLYYEDIIGESYVDGEDQITYLTPLANIAVCRFFEVEEVKLYSTTKKKNKEDISVYLPNINEIKNVFRNTKYRWMVE